MALADLLVHAALGAWLGSIVFFSFVAAPVLFDELGSERAGAAVNAVFPRYYAFGLAMAGVVLVVWLVGELAFGRPEPPLLADLGVLAAFLANVYARYSLVPKMEEAGDHAFSRYHRRSVALNGVALLGVAAAFAALHA